MAFKGGMGGGMGNMQNMIREAQKMLIHFAPASVSIPTT